MCVHRIPLPTSVTIASRPSYGCGTDERKPLIWGRHKAEYFFRRDWTTQIALNHLTKSRFTRGPFAVIQVVRTAQRPRKSTWSAGRRAKSLEMGQSEEKSVRVYVFRFALKLGHCSTQPALRICHIERTRFAASRHDGPANRW